MKRSDLKVLVTSCGMMTFPERFFGLVGNDDVAIEVIGADMNPRSVGASLVDKFHKLPAGSDPFYADAVIDVCHEEEVDVVIPAADTEALALARLAEDRDLPFKVLAPSSDAIEMVTDKFSLYREIRNMGMPGLEAYLPRTESEMYRALHSLGWPDMPVVVKPTQSWGSRGVWFIDESMSGVDWLGDRSRSCLNLHAFQRLMGGDIKQCLHRGELVFTEALKGSSFTVGVLAVDGDVQAAVPLEKVNGFQALGTPSMARVNCDPMVLEMVDMVVSSFELDWCVNIEMAYRAEGLESHPLVYDLNPRVSACMGYYPSLGFDMVGSAACQIFGYDTPLTQQDVKEHHGKMLARGLQSFELPRGL